MNSNDVLNGSPSRIDITGSLRDRCIGPSLTVIAADTIDSRPTLALRILKC